MSAVYIAPTMAEKVGRCCTAICPQVAATMKCAVWSLIRAMTAKSPSLPAPNTAVPPAFTSATTPGKAGKKTLSARFVGNGGSRWTGRVLTRSPQNPDVLWCASVGDGVFKSLDNGATWIKSGGEALYPNDLTLDRANPNRLWLSTGGGKVKGKDYKSGFYRSDDGGASWQPIEGATPSEIVQDPKDANLIYGIFQNAFIKRSSDGGTTWQDLEQRFAD